MTDQNATSGPIVTARTMGHSIWLQYMGKELSRAKLARATHNEQWLGVVADHQQLESALSASDTIDADIAHLIRVSPQISPREVYRRLAIHEVQDAADALQVIYQESNGQDGLVTLPLMPTLAEDAAATVAMAVDLHKHINRANVLYAVPANQEGLKAVEAMLSLGMNVNVTQVHSISRYRQVVHTYLRGLERRLADNMPIDYLCSIVSFGIGSVDRFVDPLLAGIPGDVAARLRGRIGIANAQVAYGHFVNLFGSEAFARLKQAGAHPQRLLWADLEAIDANEKVDPLERLTQLIGPDTISALSPGLLHHLDSDQVAKANLTHHLADAHAAISALSKLGISLTEIAETLTQAGIEADTDAFNRILGMISDKSKQGLN